jgi:hypothetical protein
LDHNSVLVTYGVGSLNPLCAGTDATSKSSGWFLERREIMTERVWYYLESGKQKGPVSTQTLNELWEQKTINPQTYLWTEGWPDWRPAQEVFRQAMPTASAQPSGYQQPFEQPRRDTPSQPSAIHGEKKDLSDRPKERREFDFFAWLIPYKNPPALIAYYFAVFSIVPLFSIFLGIPAVILGIKGIKKRSQDPTIMGAVHAWFGVICGGLFSLLGITMIIAAIVGITEATKAANPQ